jgi:serine/threonine protein phosphatase PrpC
MIVVTSFSEAGGHADNEDACVVLPHPSGPDRWLCFLADGQGGRTGGADAARLACRAAAQAAVRQRVHALMVPDTWESILGAADRAVAADREAGYTTLIGFLVTGEFVAGASCGDSAVLMLSRSDPGRELTRGQRKNSPVGSGGADIAPFLAAMPRPWSVLAMSDGVWKYVGWDRLVQAARGSRGQPLVEALQALARLPRSGQFPDDFTVVVFEDDDGRSS